jgi:hypothetical protein
MRSQRIPAGCTSDPESPVHEDDAIEFAVIAHLVHLHPTRLTIDEAVRELADDSIAGSGTTGVHDAIRSLVRVGLLRCDGEYVVPTRSTLRLADLWDQWRARANQRRGRFGSERNPASHRSRGVRHKRSLVPTPGTHGPHSDHPPRPRKKKSPASAGLPKERERRDSNPRPPA